VEAGGLELSEIRTRAEGRGFTGADHDTRHVALPKPIRKQPKFLDGSIREHIHRAAGHVEDKVQHAARRRLNAELRQLRPYRHCSISIPVNRSLVYDRTCELTVSSCIPLRHTVH
jgi:hypothetical protein